MTKKYEFVTGDTKVVNGVTLKRVRALVFIPATMSTPEVNIGDIGGYIEHENNLDNSITSNAWVYENARVYGNARVSGDAWILGNAWVYDNARVYGGACIYGNARVYGDAHVFGNARVSGGAWVYGNARVYGDARVSGDACISNDNMLFWASKVGTENGTITVFNTRDNSLLVTRGCFIGTPEEFFEASRKKHDSDTHKEYQLLIEVATSRITRRTKQRNDEIA